MPAAALAGLNLRDLGGLPVAGGVVRPGLLYRSEGPANFDDDARAAVAALDVALVCDLRSAIERRRGLPGRRTMACDIVADFRSGEAAAWRMLDPHEPVGAVRARMIATYRAMPAALAPHLATLVGAIGRGELPLLVLCTAGKDRTGMLIAILLALIGADGATIRADYLRSAAFGTRAHNRARVAKAFATLTGHPVAEAVVATLLAADPAYLAAGLDEIDRGWGSLAGYLAAAGVDEAARAAATARLVAPALTASRPTDTVTARTGAGSAPQTG